MGNISVFILPIVMIGMLFFMTRSQKKQQKQRQDLLSSMKVGDKVVTIGGLHGVISEFNEDKRTVTLDCEGIFLEFDRASIKTVKVNATAPATPAKEATEETK